MIDRHVDSSENRFSEVSPSPGESKEFLRPSHHRGWADFPIPFPKPHSAPWICTRTITSHDAGSLDTKDTIVDISVHAEIQKWAATHLRCRPCYPRDPPEVETRFETSYPASSPDQTSRPCELPALYGSMERLMHAWRNPTIDRPHLSPKC